MTSSSKQLKDLCRVEDAERSHKLVGNPAIRFIPQGTLEDGEACETFTLDLKLAPTTKSSSMTVDEEGKAEEGQVTKDKSTYKQKFKNLCTGSAEEYIK